jgi:hypothetical protein
MIHFFLTVKKLCHIKRIERQPGYAQVIPPCKTGFRDWHRILSINFKLPGMSIYSTTYSVFLNAEKWISKTDFIYKIKSHCDAADEQNSAFLHFLYQLRFSQVKKGNEGQILFRF